MEERPPIRRVAANILNKQSRTADEGWSSRLGVQRGANKPSLLKPTFSNTSEMIPLDTKQSGGKLLPIRISGGVILGESSRNTKRYDTRYVEC